MPHDVTLITTIAAAFGLALVFGFVAARLGLPALVGYLVAGILIGPGTPGFVADQAIAAQLAEIGVMLLMFGVGLHFSLADLMAVRKIALPGAVAQMAVATLLGIGLAHWWGWTLGEGLVFGLALSVASTVVLLKALEGLGAIDSINGRIAVGWLIVEDLAMVLALVLLPALAGALGGAAAGAGGSLWLTLGRTLLEVAAFVALMLVVGRRVFPWLLWQVTKTGSRELFTLCVIAAAIGIAYGSAARWLNSDSRSTMPAKNAPPTNRCRCATPSRCCSSSRSACCSTPRCWSSGPARWRRWSRSSCSASRWPPPRWCCCSATR